MGRIRKIKEKKRYVIPNDITDNDIAVIGMAGRFPKAADVDQFWVNLREGLDCISQNKRSILPEASWGGFIDNIEFFDSDFFSVSSAEAKRMDPRQRIFLEVAWHAIEDSGYGGIHGYNGKKIQDQ